MNILVCVKPVPDPDKYSQLMIDPQTKRLVREGVPTVINPTDRNALEAALRLKEAFGGRITVLSMAPEFSRDKMVESLAMGADEAFLLSDRVFGGADTYATSYVLAEGIRKAAADAGAEGFDLILAGHESADGATSHVPTQVAEWLRLPHVCAVSEIAWDEAAPARLNVTKKTAEGDLLFDVQLPAVLGVLREINKPRLVNAMGIVKARKKPLTVLTCGDLGIDPEKTGLAGSPTQPGALIQPDLSRGGESLGDELEEAAKRIRDIIAKAGV